MGRHESRVEVSGGGQLAVVDHGGSGPDVLLVHSVCHASPVWNEVAQRLTSHAHVVTFDLRGHGQSSADVTHVDQVPADIVELVQALGLRHPVLVGHDVAGGFAAAVAAAHPDTIGGLVVIDSPVVESQEAVREMVRMVGADVIADMLTQRFALGTTGADEASKDAFLEAYSRQNATDLLSAAPDAPTTRALLERAVVVAEDGSWEFRPTGASVRALTRDPDAAEFQPGRELLAEVAAPVTVITLTEGRNSPGNDALTELAAGRENVHLLTLDSGPHALYLAADDVADAIRDTVQRSASVSA